MNQAKKKKEGITRRDVLKSAAVVGAGATFGFPGILRAAKRKEVRIGFIYGAQIHQWLAPIGEGKEYFKEEGLEAQILSFTSAGIMGPHIAKGEMDIGLMGLASVLLTRAQGVDVKVVASQNQGGSAFVVAPEIKKFEDLRDKPVGHPGVGAVQHVLLTHLIQKYKTPVKEVTVKPSDMPVLAKNKEVLGIQQFEPFISMIVQNAPGWRRLILDTDYLPGNQCCVAAVLEKYAKENPDVIEKIMRIHAKTTKYYLTHPKEACQMITESSGHDLKVTTEAYKYMVAPWPPWVNSETAKTTIKWMIEGGKIDAKAIQPNVDTWWSSLYDPTYEKNLEKSGLIKKLEKEGIPV